MGTPECNNENNPRHETERERRQNFNDYGWVGYVNQAAVSYCTHPHQRERGCDDSKPETPFVDNAAGSLLRRPVKPYYQFNLSTEHRNKKPETRN
jgi:hypothetical protein